MPSSDLQARAAPNPLKRPRQDPVSCEFCRSKKLKCNRQNPCSNCASRGLTCNGQSPRPTKQSHVEDAGDLSVLARLKRLEDIVLGKTASSSDSKPNGFHSGNVTDNHGRSVPSPNLACVSPASEYQEVVQSLEQTGTRESPPWAVPRGLDIRIVTTHQISIDQDKLMILQPASRSLCLPPKTEAMILVDHYFKYIDLLQHVVHVPTVRAMIDSVYANLESGLPVAPADVVLLLAILSSASAPCSYFAQTSQTTISPPDAALASVFWTHSALETLEFTRRTAPRKIQDIQAGIILGFQLFHEEGFSTRARCIFAGAAAMARNLSLHKIDAPSIHKPGSPSRENALEMEVKRRVWWHVAATDWMLALSGGPQEGTYSIQPRHMCVKRIRNIDDEDLMNEAAPLDRPLSQPTAMSYYIQRIKLAEICRDVIDVIPLAGLDLSTVDYQDIIALDRKFECFLRDLPDFLKTEPPYIQQSEPIMKRYPHMQIQRFALGMMAHTRRCKLHQPFLIRRSVERHYDFSRKISLQSARLVIRLQELLSIRETEDFVSTSAKHTGVIYHIFMATIVLVMDLCFNKADEGEDDAARKEEVVAACKVLDEAKTQSGMASSFLDSLMDVLRKHKVRLYNHNNIGLTQPMTGVARVMENALPHRPSSQAEDDVWMDSRPAQPSSFQQQQQQQQQHVVSYDAFATPALDLASEGYIPDFDAIWKEYVELGPNMDMPGWDSLFSDLDLHLR